MRFAKGMVYYFFPNSKNNVVSADIIYTDLYYLSFLGLWKGASEERTRALKNHKWIIRKGNI